MNLRDIIERLRLPFRDDKELRRQLRQVIGFYPNNISHYKLALTHKSSGQRNDKGRPLHNERLEFLGDAMLDATVQSSPLTSVHISMVFRSVRHQKARQPDRT